MVEHLSSEQKVAGSSPVLSIFFVKLCVFQAKLLPITCSLVFCQFFSHIIKKARKNGMEDGILFYS